METLYQNTVTVKSLKKYFQPYLDLLTKPSGTKMFLVLLGMLAMQFVTSIRHIHKWFLVDICGFSLNAYYYLLSYTEIPLNAFLKITARNALALVPAQARDLPVLLIIDDTLLAKFGTHFECYQTMFDHAKRNGKNFMNGHCFVALSISVPVIIQGGVKYLNIPLGFRLRSKEENKLQIASKMIDEAMEALADYPMTILLCDSWYPKGVVCKTVMKYKNLELIANVRVDTSIFELPPPKTGKRGRPYKKGAALDIYTDLHFIRAGDYFTAVRKVMTNLFEHPVFLTVTAADLNNHKSYRVFISTLMPDAIKKQFRGYENSLSDSLSVQIPWLLPLYLYSYRWAIEVCFYEMKAFWSFGLYMLRSKNGVENYVNLLCLCYACMKILPFSGDRFSFLKNESVQTAKYVIGDALKQELFLWRFASNSEKAVNYQNLFSDFSHPLFRSSQDKVG